MKELLTAEREANDIMMDTFKGVHVLIEGINDRVVYSKFVDKKRGQLTIGFGYEKILTIIEILEGRSFDRAIGIIDADFRHIDKDYPKSKNVFLTDYHDLELLVYNSRAFDVILEYHGSANKIAKFKNERNQTIKESILEMTIPLGYLKYLNIAHKWGYTFKAQTQDGKPLKISEFIPPDRFTFLGNEFLINAVLKFCSGKGKITCTKEETLNQLGNYKPGVDPLQLCNGHDTISILSIALKRAIGNQNSSDCCPEQLEKELMLAYDSRCFISTSLYSELKSWENKVNKPFLNL